jgi:dTMP kinase
MGARGLFITMEGGEGVGKSTNLAFLERLLIGNNIDVVTTREPGGTPLGEQIRELLLQVGHEGMSPTTELLLIFAARAQHIQEVIEPALATGKWVLCDRFTDATYAYQCGGRGLECGIVRQLEELVHNKLQPDFTVLLDVPVSTGMARAKGRGNLDRFEQESLEFFERVRSYYLQLARENYDRYRVIDASAALEEVQAKLSNFAAELLSYRAIR